MSPAMPPYACLLWTSEGALFELEVSDVSRVFSSARSDERSAAPYPPDPGRRLTTAARAAVEALESRVCLSAALLPIADTFVRNHEFRGTNFGASPVLGVKTAISGDARTAFLKFDLAVIGTN